MKKIIFLLTTLLITICANAQIADTEFGESYYEVYNKVTNRFGAPEETEKQSIYYFDKSYAGFDWGYITFDFKYDVNGERHLQYVGLSKDFKYLDNAKRFLNQLKSNLDYKFVYKEKDRKKIISYVFIDSLKQIELYIYPNTKEVPYSVTLSYTDQNEKYTEENLFLPFPYATFGEEKYSSEPKITKRFGEPDYNDREHFAYGNATFADIKWNLIMFTYKYDSSTNHLCSIVFENKFNSPENAKKFRENIIEELEKKYTILQRIGDNGFKEYQIEEIPNYLINITIKKEPDTNKYCVLYMIAALNYWDNDKL